MNIFTSHKINKEAKAVLHDAKMTLNMNRDLYDSQTVAEFEGVVAELAQAHKTGDNLESVTTRTRDYTNTRRTRCASPFMRELIETIVVAIGVAMAFRAYFFQPFKIPTGSMQPTLYGIHSETRDPNFQPGFFDKHPFKIFKWAFTGVWYKEVVAESSSTVAVYQDDVKAPGYYIVVVDGKKNKVPVDAFQNNEVNIPGRTFEQPTGMADALNPNLQLRAKGFARPGDVIWKGYNISGDQLFVNRVAWNFARPKRDDVIVFTTSNPSLHFTQSAANKAVENARKVSPAHKNLSYTKPSLLPFYFVEMPFSDPSAGNHYIKRLVGMPGEQISINAPHVYADGKKVEGYFGMDRVAQQYAGYCNTDYARYLHHNGSTLAISDGAYLPMGDNTQNSYDGRYWGPVPYQHMLGPAAFVYWPISKRWGRVVK